MADLPDGTLYGTVVGQFIQAVADSADPDREPDSMPMSGTVTFTPAATRVALPDTVPNPVTMFQKTITATLDSEGYLVGPDGQRGILLIASDSPGNPTDFTYSVAVSLSGVQTFSFSFFLNAGATVDLTTVIPATSQPGFLVPTDDLVASFISTPGTVTNSELSATFMGVADGALNRSGQDSRITELAAQAANNAAKYLYTELVDGLYPGTAEITAFGGTGEVNIRPPASFALLLATLLAKGQYDPTIVGRSESDARVQAVRFIVSLANKHRANGGVWGGLANTGPDEGGGWQEALWANLFCSAGWLLRADLSVAELANVKDVAVWEANRMVPGAWTIRYWKDAAGVEITPGDSKSEEIAWNAGITMAALALDPLNPNASDWYLVLVRAGLAHNAIPADLTDDVAVNGVVPSAFLTGTNVNPDGTIVNHDRIHPNYMAASAHGLYGFFAVAAEAGVEVPRAAKRNAELLYQAFTAREFEPGTIGYPEGPLGGYVQAPGGTIYPWPPGDGAIYFPQGTDYGYERIASFVPFNVCAHRFGWDRGLTPAAFWAVLHLERQVANQARFTTGQSFGPGEGGSLASEAIVGANMAFALLTILADDLTFSANLVVDTSSWAGAVTSLQPRAWYKLDETSGTVVADSSGAGRHGYVVGSEPTWNQPSLIPSDPSGKSVTTAGSRIIMVDNGPWLDGPISYVCVYRRASIASEPEVTFARFSTGGGDDDGGAQFNFDVRPTTGYARLQVYPASGGAVVEAGLTSFSVQDGNPHLFGATIDATGARFYVDGALIATWAGAPRLTSDARLHMLARRVNGVIQTVNDMNGSFLDDCVVFGALTDDQHNALWTAFNA